MPPSDRQPAAGCRKHPVLIDYAAAGARVRIETAVYQPSGSSKVRKYRTLAACYAHMGRLDEAREVLDIGWTAPALNPGRFAHPADAAVTRPIAIETTARVPVIAVLNIAFL